MGFVEVILCLKSARNGTMEKNKFKHIFTESIKVSTAYKAISLFEFINSQKFFQLTFFIE